MRVKVNPKKWKVNLPTFPPGEDMDTSTMLEYGRCPRKGFYRYGLRRGFPGQSYSIQFGLAYHKFREVLETKLMEGAEQDEALFIYAFQAATENFENPPIGHKDEFLDKGRLLRSCHLAYERVEKERELGHVVITRAEDSFDLELPALCCSGCGNAYLDYESDAETTKCKLCGGSMFRIRQGGRVDNFLAIPSKQQIKIRDFKTTKYKPKDYEEKYDPNSQMFAYTWAQGELSGQKSAGAVIETLHNTKTQGPDIYIHEVSFTPGQYEAWIASVMMERQMIQMMWSKIDELGYLAFPMRTSECSTFGGCPFRAMCRSTSGFMLEEELKARTISSTWDYTNPDLEESKV